MDLLEGEEIIFRGHPSWRAVLRFYAVGVVLVILAGAVAAAASQVAEDEVKAGWVVLALLVALAVLLVAGFLKRAATEYVITTRRLHIRRGLLSRRTEQTRIERIQNINTSQSPLERLLRVGTVDFDVASDERQDLFRFVGVADPQGVVRALDRALHGGDVDPSGL